MQILQRRLRNPQLQRALAAAAAVFLLACSGGGQAESTSTTLTREEQVKREVASAYNHYLEMTRRLASSPDPEDPEIALRSTGQSRDALIQALDQLRAGGERIQFGDDNSSEILSIELVDDDTAVIEECAVDDAATVRANSGDIVSSGLATGIFRVTIEQEGDVWRVAATPAPVQSWDGLAGCATE